MKYHFNKSFLVLLICVLVFFIISCPGNPYSSYYKDPGPKGGPERDPSEYDERDRLSSWDHINQLITRPDDWVRIVNDISLFQLSNDYKLTYNWESSGFVYRYYDRSYGTFPAIDGSTVLLPLAAEAGWQFLDLSDDNTRSFYNFSTTFNAYMKLINNNYTNGSLTYFSHEDKNTMYYNVYEFYQRPDIIFVTSPSALELSIAANQGVNLTIKPVCYDSFVFITHIDNPIDNLTVGQVRAIYSGQITNWSQIGGADWEIVAFQREPGSGSQTAMEEMVMGGLRMMDAPSGWYHVGMGMLIDFVAEYQNEPNSIGYTFKYFIDRLYINPNIKILRMNDVEPNDDNVRNKTYPFVAPYNGVIRTIDANNVGGKFLDWMLSEEGQRVIAQAGYVTLSSAF
jgi:phosphate transport system substrate-binding protein